MTRFGMFVVGILVASVIGPLAGLVYHGMAQSVRKNTTNIETNDKRLDKHDTYFAEMKAYREADAKFQERQAQAMEALTEEMKKRRQEGQ